MDLRQVILTGSSGYLGKFLFENLEIKDIYRYSRDNHKNIDDISAEGIIHCAGLAHNLADNSNYLEYFKANVQLTERLLDYFNNSSANYFIFISTSVIYNGLPENIILTEEMVGNDHGSYAKTKLLAENLLLSRVTTNKKIIILRPSIIVSENPKGNLALLQKLLRLTRIIILPKKLNKIHTTDIRNIKYVIEYIHKNHVGIESGIYNIQDTCRLDLSKIIKHLGSLEGKNIKIIRFPNFIFSVIIFVLLIIFPKQGKKMKRVLFEKTIISNRKIETMLSKPLPYNSFNNEQL